MIAPSLVKPRAMEGTGFLGQAADDVYQIEGQDLYLVGTSEVAMAAYHSDEILDAASLPLRYAAFSPCFRKEAGSHGKDTRGIFRVHWFDKVEMFVYTTPEESYAEHQRLLGWRRTSSTSSSWPTGSSTPPRATSACRRSASSTARRGSRPRAGTASSPRPRTAPTSRPAGWTSAAGSHDGGTEVRLATLNGTLCAVPRAIVAILETHQQADGSVRVPEALRPSWRPRGPRAGGRVVIEPRSSPTRPDRLAPRLVALDIDGTLLKWVEGGGPTHETITPPVHDAVHRALDAGAHIVLASGRSPHGMTHRRHARPPRRRADRLWVVACNGAVVFRYPPMEVVHEETFDAAPAVAAVLEHHPEALVAVEERGVGYRVNRLFPDGELSGEMIITEVEEIVAGPVSRVIIRDPDATADDFVELAARLGLHGTDYVVGWTAWLDLSPVGVSKASGLPARRRARPSTAATCSPSATVATTSRCCAGPAGAWPWARPSTRSGTPPTTSPTRSTTTARRSRWSAGSMTLPPGPCAGAARRPRWSPPAPAAR